MKAKRKTSEVYARIDRNIGDRFGDYPDRFQRHLETLGYSPHSLKHYRFCIGTLSAFLRTHRIAVKDLGGSRTKTLLGKAGWPSPDDFRIRNFIAFLAQQGAFTPVAEPPPKENSYAALQKRYATYLLQQRGLAEATIDTCWEAAKRFLKFRFGDAIGDLASITQLDVVKYLQHLYAGPEPYRAKSICSLMRRFLQYLFSIGITRTDISLTIPSCAQRYGARLPRHLSPQQVELVISGVRAQQPTSRRNYAMVLLLARLGLRPTEVIAMEINDIDWRSGEITIRGKGHRFDRIPMPHEVGEAIAEYIRLERMSSSRRLFVTNHAPRVPFKNATILNSILKSALADAGLRPPVRHVGAYLLRHSLATTLVRQGASLDEISNVLRHRSRASTMIYAKLDIEGLRSIAPQWPMKGGVK